MDCKGSEGERISEKENSECSVDSANRVAELNSSRLGGHEGSETVIVIRSDEEETASVSVSGKDGDLNSKGDVLGSSKSGVDEGKIKGLQDNQHSCVIDVKCGGGGDGEFGENFEGEKVCRICHLSSDPSSEATTTCAATTDLIHLGCGCKDELGIAHLHCAEAWFKLRGNRQCEICGETVVHIKGVADNRFMEEWNDRTSTANDAYSTDGGGGCWRGQPFCNFLMACLVIAFVLPWFFRVNMF